MPEVLPAAPLYAPQTVIEAEMLALATKVVMRDHLWTLDGDEMVALLVVGPEGDYLGALAVPEEPLWIESLAQSGQMRLVDGRTLPVSPVGCSLA